MCQLYPARREARLSRDDRAEQPGALLQLLGVASQHADVSEHLCAELEVTLGNRPGGCRGRDRRKGGVSSRWRRPFQFHHAPAA